MLNIKKWKKYVFVSFISFFIAFITLLNSKKEIFSRDYFSIDALFIYYFIVLGIVFMLISLLFRMDEYEQVITQKFEKYLRFLTLFFLFILCVYIVYKCLRGDCLLDLDEISTISASVVTSSMIIFYAGYTRY